MAFLLGLNLNAQSDCDTIFSDGLNVDSVYAKNMLPDTLNREKWVGTLGAEVRSIGTSVDRLDSAITKLPNSKDRIVPLSHGQIEIGAVHGFIPFAQPGRSKFNGYARGSTSFQVLGLPLGLTFDLGTDLPIRGQRNSVRFNFDTPKALDSERVDHSHKLQRATEKMDSLLAKRSALQRDLLGHQALLDTDSRSHLARFPTIATPNPSIAPVLPDAEFDPPSRPLLPEADAPQNLQVPELVDDSITFLLNGLRSREALLDSLIQQQREIVQRCSAIVNAAGVKEGTTTHFTRGIKRLEFGSCAPNASEFLINGTNFQGLSFEYEHKDLFLSIDHGRSFDDAWQNTDPVTSDLRRLRQSLFFSDVQDLNPRKLTALRFGTGGAEGSHVHIGYLHGKRNDLPLGMANTGIAGLELKNHVIELDAGHVFWKHHQLRIVYARSLVIGGVSNFAEDNGDNPSLVDLISGKAKQNEAVKLRWTSDIHKTGTTVELEARQIDPHFQSFGMGFVRNGTNTVELRCDQRIGDRLRLRIRGVMEDRDLPTSDQKVLMHIRRGIVAANWNITRSLNLRCTASPVLVRTNMEGSAPAQTLNQAWTGGAGWRTRWHRATVLLDADVTMFMWGPSSGPEEHSLSQVVGLSISHGDRWSIRCTNSSVRLMDTDSLATITNRSLQLGYRSMKGFRIDGSMQLPNDHGIGWTLLAKQQINKKFAIQIEGRQIARLDVYLSTINSYQSNDAYTWTLAFQYLW